MSDTIIQEATALKDRICQNCQNWMVDTDIDMIHTERYCKKLITASLTGEYTGYSSIERVDEYIMIQDYGKTITQGDFGCNLFDPKHE